MTISSDRFYMRFSLNLISICLIGFILYVGQDILMPLMFAGLLATLLVPFVNWIREHSKIPKVLAIILCLALALSLILGLIYFLIFQVSLFLKDSGDLLNKMEELLQSIQQWLARDFNMGVGEQEQYIKDTAENIKTSGPQIIGKTFLSLTDILTYLVFIPVFSFLLLYYKNLVKRFLIKLFSGNNEGKVTTIIHECQTVSQQYITGLLIDMSIVFVLNSVGFLIIGVKYALLLALLAALLNLVPYVGMLVANIISILITIATASLHDAIWVGVVLAAVQIVDNNILMPMIVGSKVKINALATILAVWIGGALCGVDGMFLAIPIVAILKVIADRVSFLKPWGLILTDESNGKKGHPPKS